MPSIYLLLDPRTAEVRYVGWTSRTLRTRLACHLSEARSGENCYKSRWVRSVLAAQLKPVILLIETAEDYQARERYWIAHYRAAGCRLTNSTDGGDGTAGRKHSEEAKARLSFLAKQRPPVSAETRARMSASGKGRSLSESHRQNMSAATKGRPKPWLRKIKPPGPGPRRGENATGAKLTWEQVRAIRAAPWPQCHQRLAEQYGVRKLQIVNILRGRDWKDPDYIPALPNPGPSAERVGTATLSWEKVRAMRAEPKGQPLKTLATKYGVSASQICVILQGKQWKEQSD